MTTFPQPGAEILRINDEAIGGHVDRIAEIGVAAAHAVPVLAEVSIGTEAAGLVVALAVFKPARQPEAVGHPDGGRVIGKKHAAREPEAHKAEPGGRGVEEPAHTEGGGYAPPRGERKCRSMAAQWAMKPAQIAPATTTARPMR